MAKKASKNPIEKHTSPADYDARCAEILHQMGQGTPHQKAY